MERTHAKFWLILSIAVLTGLGCTLPNILGDEIKDLVPGLNTTSAAPQNSPAMAATAETIQTMESTSEIVEQVQEAFEDTILSLTEKDRGMLDSYRTYFSIHMDSSDPATSNFFSIWEIHEEEIIDQSLYHNQNHYESTDVISTGDTHIYKLGDQLYFYAPGNSELPCIALPKDTSGAEEFVRPEDVIPTIAIDTLLERGVTINGVLSDHYRVKNWGLEILEVTSQSGEVWVAQDGGFVVRYIGSAEGRYIESGIDVISRWEYNLTDINQVAVIDLPVECRNQESAVEDVPIPEHATNIQKMAGIIMYDSIDSPEQIGDYYRTQLPENGWRITEDDSMAGLVMLTAEKEGQNLQIMVTPGSSGGSSVIISTVPLK